MSKNILSQQNLDTTAESQQQALSSDQFDINGGLIDVLGVVCESDTGLRLSEQCSFDLSLSTSNGVNEGRRDKYMMQEQLKHFFKSTSVDNITSSSVADFSTPPSSPPFVRQILTDKWSEAKSFLLSLEESGVFPAACVIKPSRGAASVGVSKATHMEGAEKQFKALLGTPGYANGTYGAYYCSMQLRFLKRMDIELERTEISFVYSHYQVL